MTKYLLKFADKVTALIATVAVWAGTDDYRQKMNDLGWNDPDPEAEFSPDF